MMFSILFILLKNCKYILLKLQLLMTFKKKLLKVKVLDIYYNISYIRYHYFY